jgi:CelD/BcsL family acetyltransferase involved in cellulose biosynthesis
MIKRENYYINDYGCIIKEVNDFTGFNNLAQTWETLSKKQGELNPFLSFEWFKIWLEHFLKNDSLLILLPYREDRILAIVPLLIRQEKIDGIKVKRIELIGNIYSPIRFLLFNSSDIEERENILFYVFEFFTKFYKTWDIINLYPLPEENNCFDLVRMAVNRTKFKPSEYFCFGDWFLDKIELSGDEYFEKLPKRVKKDIAYNQRRLRNMGHYEFKVINNGDVDHYIDIYYDVYSRSWQERESIGPHFHRDLAKMAARNNWLRLGFLFFNNVAMASQFWLACDGTAYILKTVYDQKFKKYSPGKILTSEMMKYVIDNDQVKTADYIHGDEAYKEDWAPKRRERKGILIYNNNIKGQYLRILNERVSPILNKNKYLKKSKALFLKRLRMWSQTG